MAKMRSRDRSVDIATKLQTGRSGFNSRRGQEVFLFSMDSRPSVAQLGSCTMGYHPKFVFMV